MAQVIIEGIRPYDGEYELDKDRAFNGREWRWVKKISGYLPLTLRDGFVNADPDLYIAIAVIALCRAGKIDRDQGLEVADEISEAPFDYAAIRIVGDKVEDDADPPALTSQPAELLRTGSL